MAYSDNPSDLKLKIKTDAGEEESNHDDRGDDLQDGDPGGAHGGDLVVGGEPPEDEHGGNERGPRNGEGQDDREDVKQEREGICGGHPAGNIFEDLHQPGAGHAEGQDTDRRQKRGEICLGDINIQCFHVQPFAKSCKIHAVI